MRDASHASRITQVAEQLPGKACATYLLKHKQVHPDATHRTQETIESFYKLNALTLLSSVDLRDTSHGHVGSTCVRSIT